MRVLVTGATGFVGERLIEPLLEAGHEVRVFVRDATDYEGPVASTSTRATCSSRRRSRRRWKGSTPSTTSSTR